MISINPIKTKKDHKAALERIDKLFNAEESTESTDELDMLTTLVQAFEEINYPIPKPDPVQAIKFRMDQQGLKVADVVQYFGQRSRVTEVLNYQRGLSLTMIRKLNAGLKIPLNILIAEYKLSK